MAEKGTQLNKEVYTVDANGLVYDGTHPVDGGVVKVTMEAAEAAGVIKKGQVLDFDSEQKQYKAHALEGTVSVIAAADAAYEQSATEVMVPVYISGTFRKSKIVCEPALDEADLEILAYKGIYLK